MESHEELLEFGHSMKFYEARLEDLEEKKSRSNGGATLMNSLNNLICEYSLQYEKMDLRICMNQIFSTLRRFKPFNGVTNFELEFLYVLVKMYILPHVKINYQLIYTDVFALSLFSNLEEYGLKLFQMLQHSVSSKSRAKILNSRQLFAHLLGVKGDIDNYQLVKKFTTLETVNHKCLTCFLFFLYRELFSLNKRVSKTEFFMVVQVIDILLSRKEKTVDDEILNFLKAEICFYSLFTFDSIDCPVLKKETASYYKDFLSICSDHSNAHYKRGYCLTKMSRNLEALDSLNASIRISAKDPEVFNQRGTVKLRLRKYQDALFDYSKACEINYPMKFKSRFYLNKGKVLLRMKKFGRAIESISQASQIDTKSSYYISARGDCFFQSKQYSKALIDYNASMKMKESPGIFLKQGQCYEKLGLKEKSKKSFESAVELYETAIKKHFKSKKEATPLITGYITNLSSALGHLKQFKRSVECLLQVKILFSQETPEALSVYHNNLGYYYLKLGLYEKSITHLQEAIRIDRECTDVFPNPFAFLGFCFLKKGNPDRAFENLKQAKSIDENYFRSYEYFGYYYMEKGEYSAAIDNFEKAQKLLGLGPEYEEIEEEIENCKKKIESAICKPNILPGCQICEKGEKEF